VTRATGASPAEGAPEDEDVEEGPPVAEDGAEAERDFAAEEVRAPAEQDIAGEDEAAPPLEEETAAEEEAPPPEEEIAAEEAPEPVEEAAAAKGPPRQAPVEPEPAIAEVPRQPEPLALVPPTGSPEDLARNRAIADELTRGRRSGRIGIDDGPRILLGGRGLQ
jgi:hypothetical protein